MGCGASAQWQERLALASVYEIRETFDALSVESYVKIQEIARALASNQPAQRAGSPTSRQIAVRSPCDSGDTGACQSRVDTMQEKLYAKDSNSLGKVAWTRESACKLQSVVDRIFGQRKSLLNLEFSFTIADPFIEDCPLIGCSTGFTKLCGYELEDIVGRNCRFLIDPVPKEHVNRDAQKNARIFCDAVRQSKQYKQSEISHEPWVSEPRLPDELFCVQKNARKDGTLFYNMFFLKVLYLGSNLGEEKPYIVGLHSELPDQLSCALKVAQLTTQRKQLDAKMLRLKDELSALFFVNGFMARTSAASLVEGSTNTNPEKHNHVSENRPHQLFENFPSDDVLPWEKGRFNHVRKLGDASRNQGVVSLYKDKKNGQLVAVKEMPNSWICGNHNEFARAHRKEMENPWQDIGCTRFLNSVNYKYACYLKGVYRSEKSTFVSLTFAEGGDLFSFSQIGVEPGPEREAALARLAVDLLSGILQLHNMQIAHRDISLENVVLTSTEPEKAELLIIDYGMASIGRTSREITGKPSYQAPEMHARADNDMFLMDAFALGVLLFALFSRDYPWLSTKAGGCKCFDYFQKHGFRAYCSKRKLRRSDKIIADCFSEPLIDLIEGLVDPDPEHRLTLGETVWGNRRSVWDEPWIQNSGKSMGA